MAKSYAAEKPEVNLAGDTMALASHIVADSGNEPGPGVRWVASLLDTPELGEETIEALCRQYLCNLSLVLYNQVSLRVVLVLLRAARAKLTELCRHDSTTGRRLSLLVATHRSIGIHLRESGDSRGALLEFEMALAANQELETIDPAFARRSYGNIYESLGRACSVLGDHDKALQYLEKSREIFSELSALNPEDHTLLRDLSVLYNALADLTWSERDRAREYFEKALVIRQDLVRRQPTNTHYELDLATSWERMGLIDRDTELAGQHLAKAIAIREDLARRYPQLTASRGLFACYFAMGRLLEDRWIELGEATASLDKALAIAEKLHAVVPDSALYAGDLAEICFYRGNLPTAHGEEGRLQHFARGLAIREELLQRDPANIDYAVRLAEAHERVADLHSMQDRPAQALEHYGRALSVTGASWRAKPGAIAKETFVKLQQKISDCYWQQQNPASCAGPQSHTDSGNAPTQPEGDM